MSQKKMYQNNRRKWNIDERNAADIENRIGELASSYVPEWHFDRENPDIGTVIGRIFARQMAGNIDRYNQVLDRYHTEFVNMLGISLLPAKPSQATVLMDLVQDTIPGIEVYKGTKLLADSGSDDAQIIFETLHNVYITNSRLQYIFMTEAAEGKIVPLKGEFDRLQIVEDGTAAVPEDEEEPEAAEALPAAGEPAEEMKSFRLFCSDEKGIQVNALLFYHAAALDVEHNNIYVKLAGDPKLCESIQRGEYRFLYYTDEGLKPVEHVEFAKDGETVVLQKEEKNHRIVFPDGEYSLLALEACGPVSRASLLTGMSVSSSGEEAPLKAAGSGSMDYDVESFDPFGDTLSLYQECYLGHDEYFSKAGAEVTLSFDVAYLEHRLAVDVQTQEESLKVIKRKPRAIWADTPAQAKADEITVEYFNGIGWKKLICLQETGRMFAGSDGKYTISFICPDDWQEAGVGAYQGRCIRIQLIKSDNCYLRPAVHIYPHISHMRVSYSYGSRYVDAQHLIALAGTRRVDLTPKVRAKEPFTAFQKSEYTEDALYLGFQRRIESGPVSLLFQMEEGVRFEGTKCRYEYSTQKGFKQMKTVDYTMDLSRSGIVMFMPPPDMHPLTIEGKRACWIRISRTDQGREPEKGALPVIRDIRPNAVQTANIETGEEEEFYLDASDPGMEISLGADHILDVDLWVNEMGSLTRPQMRRMLEETPQIIRAEYNILGEISTFFVKWEETDQLDHPASPRSYMLDRMNNTLIFGDGIHAKLPRVFDDVAFRIQIRRCRGREGNVEAGSINSAMGNLMFVEQIYNPMKAYGGSSIESLESALGRGANILKSRRRLVSADDYVQEVLNFSDSIDKVRCIVGETVHGTKRDGAITFVILLRDFEEGSYSFHNVAGALKERLLTTCELTVPPDDLAIVEPVFAHVSVDVWAEVVQMDDSFELQNLLQETLERYLNPVSSEQGDGWEIGAMPKRSQILMRLNILKSRAIIKKLVVTVSYTDQTGSHEVDLEDLEENPFMVCCNGSHRVNIMLSDR